MSGAARREHAVTHVHVRAKTVTQGTDAAAGLRGVVLTETRAPFRRAVPRGFGNRSLWPRLAACPRRDVTSLRGVEERRGPAFGPRAVHVGGGDCSIPCSDPASCILHGITCLCRAALCTVGNTGIGDRLHGSCVWRVLFVCDVKCHAPQATLGAQWTQNPNKCNICFSGFKYKIVVTSLTPLDKIENSTENRQRI